MHPVPPPAGPSPDPLAHLSPQAARLLSVLEADWRTISRTSPVPRHADIDPLALHAALPHAFVAQQTGLDALRIRVAGQALHDGMGFDPRGMSVGCFFTDDAGARVVALMQDCLADPAILGVPLIGARRFSRHPVRGYVLALPLADATGQVTKIMGAIVSHDTRTRSGLRWDVAAAPAIRRQVLGRQFADSRASDPVQPGLRLVVDNTRS
ncbi:PAS domain-containing protein [Loktanella sp. 3ANDIMAR09]|uniref:PAS domain-containing protein n=1 Tax=Loktanella sp. 3ANDIMAR09 TaxID=1225657 RepID=UPI0009F8C463|nr:PAS domain-containing protein [Loktanella sp. 3ANDIMAR09]